MTKQKTDPNYPTLNEYKSRKFLNIATAVGIGISAAAISINLEADNKKSVEAKATDKKTEKSDIKAKIILFVANLGHKDFKERDIATKSLIDLGKKFKKEKKTALTEFLKSEIKKQSDSKDPEIKERAKKILLAITPKPPDSNIRVFRTGGVMIQRN